jgi:molybdopterin-guanine dinucleotide biosynthesis protein A
MGRDKTQLVVDGSTLATRSARLLLGVVETAIEVGPGFSGLATTLEQSPGSGPLAAVAAGRRALVDLGCVGDALVIACDMPLLTNEILRYLVEFDAPGSVVPVVRGRPQPLCARWSQADLDATEGLVESGERSLRKLLARAGVVFVDESAWGGIATEQQFSDVDVPADLERLGVPLRFRG